MAEHNRILWLFTVGSIVTALSGVPAKADTETSAVDSGAIPEIVVTAEKRSTSLQSTPAAVTAVTGNTLAAEGIKDANALELVVPSADFKQAVTSSMIFIRGVGNSVTAPAVDPGVSFNVNGIYVPRDATGTNLLYDVQQVEVLPGPQGTLWGRNSAGGAVNVVTNRPTKEFSGNALLEAGDYGSVHTEAALNLPLGDRLQVRGAFNSIYHDGYLSNGGNDEKSNAGRLTLAAQPTDDIDVLFWGSASHDGGVGSMEVNAPYANPNHPYYSPISSAGIFLDATHWTLGGEAAAHFDGLTLTYIPAYDNYKLLTVNESGGSLIHSNPTDDHQVSNELRLANDGGGPWKWTVGLYQYQLEQSEYLTFNGSPILALGENQQESYALFGQATYSFTDSFRATLGGRYSSDEKKADGVAPNAVHVQTAYSADHTWTRGDWKAGIEQDLFLHSMLYATVQTGYVAGAYSNVPDSPTFSNLISPETLRSYTLGLKNRFFDNRLEINSEAYYYDFRNFQVTARSAVTGVTTVQSASKVEIYGDQLDVRYLPTENDSLHANLGWLHSRYIEFTLNTGANYDGLQTVDSPDYTANGGYQHIFELGGAGTITGEAETHFESSHWVNFQHSPYLRQPAYSKTDLDLTYAPVKASWTVGLYIFNAENKAVAANGAFGAKPGPSTYYLEPPRTYGVRGTVSF